MKTSRIIMRRELAAFFVSPIAYIVIGLFLIFSGFLFFSIFFLANRAELRQFFVNLPLLFAFFIPALTMRVFSEEQRSGSLETLLTLPVTAFDVVLGKFLASFIFTVVMIAPSVFYAITAAFFGTLDMGPIIGGYLGALFLAASFTAIGIFTSVLTKNQIIAFFIAFTVSIVLVMVDQFLVFLPAGIVTFLQYLSAGSHFTSISRGIIDSRDLIYFTSLTIIFFTLTVKTLDSRRVA